MTHITEKNVTGKFVDDKRKKNLSASQCHQVYLYLSKEELHLK